MFGFKLVKEKDLKNLEIKLDMIQNAYRIMVEESQLNLDIAWDLRMDNAELEDTICMYEEALEQQTRAKRAMPASYKELYAECEELKTVLESYRKRMEFADSDTEEFAWYGS